MANTLIVKRSSVVGKVPLSTDLQVGELAVNLADQKIYSKNAGGTVVELGGSSGSGDVVGPASATDNALVRFDGTTGKLIQNSTATLDDTGNMDTASLKADYFDLDTAATAPADAVGRTAWDDGSGGSILGLKGGVVTYYTGQQEFARVYNGSGAAMTKGQVVYIVGAQGNRIDVRLAQANAESTSANTIGLVAEPIAAGAEGWVQTTGPLPKLDTSTLTAGQTIYLSPTTAGAYTTTKPSAPNHLVILGFVERVSATVGSIYLKVDNGYELDELHNVNTTSPTGGQLLAYDQTAGYWKNITLTDGTGVSITETTAGAVTIGLATAYGDTLNPYASKTANNFLAAPNGAAGVPTFRAIVAADIPTLNQNTTGTAANVTGTVAIANGGSGATTAAAARTNFGATTVGANLFTLTNPSAITFLRVNADNTVSALDAATFRTSIGAGTSSTTGTVTSVGGTGTVSGLSLSGTVTTSGNLTLGGTLAVLPSNFASQTANTVLAAPNGAAGVPTFRAIVAADIPTLNQNTTGTAANVTGTVAVANGGTGATTAATARTNLGATTLGGNLYTLANVAAIAFPRFNADNTVSSLDAATFRTAIGAGTGNGNGTVTSVSGTGTVVGLTLTGTVTTSGSLTLGGTFALPNGQVTTKMIYNSFTATAAQTTFTTTNTYTSEKIEVFVNGVKLVNGTDVTVTSGTSVVMAAGLPVGTRVDLVYPI